MIEQPVVSRQARSRHVSPSDFLLGQAREIDRIPANATPYCVDFEHQCLLCVTSREILDRPFLHQAQRQHAKTVISVPFAELPEVDVTPTLIFSPGRCGSTLLHRILSAIGLPSISEPDCFRQVADQFVLARNPAPEAIETSRRILRAATTILTQELNSRSPVIKLGVGCNLTPVLIAGAFSQVKIIFIIREPREWASSLKRAWPQVTVQRALQILSRALWVLDRLSKLYTVRICRYRDFSRPDASYYRDLVSFVGHDKDIQPAVLAAVLSKDAQDGTRISRSALASRETDPLFLEEFEKVWSTVRASSRLAELLA